MGAEICLALAREGAHLALAAREAAPLEKLAGEIEKLGRRASSSPPTSPTRPPSSDSSSARRRSSAGASTSSSTPPASRARRDAGVGDQDRGLGSRAGGERQGHVPAIKHVLPTMIAQRYGKIVNISGTSGLRGYKLRASYSSSKWALRGLTRTVALEAGPYNVTSTRCTRGSWTARGWRSSAARRRASAAGRPSRCARSTCRRWRCAA